MTADKPFTEQREEIAKRVAKKVHERRKKIRQRFGERKYGDYKPTPDERRGIYGELVLNPEGLEEEYRKAWAEAGISPGLLPRRFIEDMFRYEAERRKKVSGDGVV